MPSTFNIRYNSHDERNRKLFGVNGVVKAIEIKETGWIFFGRKFFRKRRCWIHAEQHDAELESANAELEKINADVPSQYRCPVIPKYIRSGCPPEDVGLFKEGTSLFITWGYASPHDQHYRGQVPLMMTGCRINSTSPDTSPIELHCHPASAMA